MYEDEELDFIEGVDEDGNKVVLQVLEYFFYNGEEYVVLTDADEECCGDCEGCASCESCHAEEIDVNDVPEENLYIMKVNTFTENGEEMEEFVPVDENLMDSLVQVVKTRFKDEFGDEEE